MLNLQAKTTAATGEPDGRSVSDLVLDGRRWCCVGGTSGHRGPFRPETGLLVLFEGFRQGYSPYETQVDGLPIWRISPEISPGLIEVLEENGLMDGHGSVLAQTAKVFSLAILLVLFASAGSANAGCGDRPGPKVDWTACSKRQLMLSNDDLTGAVFSRALLASTDFARSRLGGVKLIEAEINLTRFEGADLSGADLQRVVGWRANFSRAKLERASFYAAELSRSVFVEARVVGTNFVKAEVNRSNFSGAELSGADMSKAELSRAVFTGAKLFGVRFTHAHLGRAELSGLDLNGVDLRGAYLFLTQLGGADLSRTVGLTQAQLDLACGTTETKLPAGMAQPESWPCAKDQLE